MSTSRSSTANRRPTVCIDCRYIRERPSGIGVWVQEMVDYLPGLAPDVDFLFLKHPKAPDRLSAAPNVIERVVKQEANGPATMFYLPRVVDFSEVDIYHNTFNLMPYRMPIPTVVTVTDIMQIKHPSWAKGPGLWGWVDVGFKRHGIERAFRKADRIIAVSNTTREEIASVDPEAASRTRVAMQGISPDFHRMKGEEGERLVAMARRRWAHGAPRYVLTVGQFSRYKNHETVVRAFAKAFGQEQDVHLVMVQRLGEGPRVLRPIAREFGVDHRVHFVRDIPLVELVALYNGAMALCHPSLYEGFGNPVSEAIACGCPVLTSNCSAMPEVVAGSALLVEPTSVREVAEGLRRIASDEGFAQELRAKGLARAEQLSWKSFAEANLATYRELLPSTKP